MSHKYEKVTTYTKQKDGSILITKKSYYEELANVIEEIEKPHHNLEIDSLKSTVDKALLKITEHDAPQLVITIKKHNGKYKLLERYTLVK